MYIESLEIKKNKELKPCPFCGSNEVVLEWYIHHADQRRVRALCTNCMAMVDAGWWLGPQWGPLRGYLIREGIPLHVVGRGYLSMWGKGISLHAGGADTSPCDVSVRAGLGFLTTQLRIPREQSRSCATFLLW